MDQQHLRIFGGVDCLWHFILRLDWKLIDPGTFPTTKIHLHIQMGTYDIWLFTLTVMTVNLGHSNRFYNQPHLFKRSSQFSYLRTYVTKHYKHRFQWPSFTRKTLTTWYTNHLLRTLTPEKTSWNRPSLCMLSSKRLRKASCPNCLAAWAASASTCALACCWAHSGYCLVELEYYTPEIPKISLKRRRFWTGKRSFSGSECFFGGAQDIQ